MKFSFSRSDRLGRIELVILAEEIIPGPRVYTQN